MKALPIALLASMLLAAVPVTAQPEAPTLEVAGDAAAGHLTLTWSAAEEDAWVFQLEEDGAADFAEPVVRYEGHQTATVRSGLPDGEYHFRVRKRPAEDGSPAGAWSAWSKPVRFQVAHHSLTLALSLFALGAVVFASTLTFLLTASRGKEARG